MPHLSLSAHGKHDLQHLLEAVERKVGKHISPESDFERLAAFLTTHHITLGAPTLKKVWSHMRHAEKPSVETLNKLALFVGYQNWSEFQKALHGDADGQENYEG